MGDAGPDGRDPLRQEHDAAVSRISREVANFHARKVPFRIFHGNTNSTRLSERTRSATVDISRLSHVISVSTSKQTCLVEPNVPMDKLVEATLRHGLIPPVVPEFPGITVGGGFAGTAGESSSFKHGFFDKAVTWLEVVLANGEVVTASTTERQDLLKAMAGTFGTLGVATLFEMRLVPAKDFVQLSYIPVKGIEHAQEVIKQIFEEGESGTDFLDGIMFSPDEGVIMTGRYADRDESTKAMPTVTFTKAWDLWFYQHVETKLRSSTAPMTDLVPLTDYLFRYDRGAFWTGRFAFKYFLIPFTRATRWLADYFMHTRIMYHALHRSGLYQRFIIQDMALPNKNMPEFSRWLDEELPHVYPRWLCPLRTGEGVSMNPHSRNPEDSLVDATRSADFSNALLNVGVWGETPASTLQVTINRQIEAKLKSLSGMKWLYAQTFYTEDEFWSIYDKEWYDSLRTKYQAEGFIPNVYEKVRTKDIFEEVGEDDGKTTIRDARLPVERGLWQIWPFAGVYGVLSALKGGDYLRKK
jgi:Delta24-sterol reductase